MADQNKNLTVVLLSGGWESTLCAFRATERYRIETIRLVFCFYGQSYRMNEFHAAKNIAHYLEWGLTVINVPDLKKDPGNPVVANRNETFIKAALDRYPDQVARIYLGSRGLLSVLDKYGDSNYQWGKRMARKYGVRVLMPCTLMPKAVVQAAVRSRGIIDSSLFSSEGLIP